MDSMKVVPVQPGESFRVCISADGRFLGRAYSAEDVKRIQGEHRIRNIHWGTEPSWKFPAGPDLDREVALLRDELYESNERLTKLQPASDEAASPEYVSELENNNEICRRILDRVMVLARITV
jgi:hypothetical protein